MKWFIPILTVVLTSFLIGSGCPAVDDGPIAGGITGKLGDPMPRATPDQLATFARGKEVMQRRFALGDGLGPAFNVTFCGGCHEKPVPGGGSGTYRNFFLGGRRTADGAFLFTESAGESGGVIRMYDYDAARIARPVVPAGTTIFAQRVGIPLFGSGLIAEVTGEEIMSRADPDDADGDGISGRVNFDRGFVGRFGRKSQTVSIEGFIRGPLFNHMGVTTVPLTDEQRVLLPVDSSVAARMKRYDSAAGPIDPKLGPHMQAAAPDGPTTDSDGVADPEMSAQDLFDLISFVMLLAAPEFDPPTAQTERGRTLFHDLNCSGCHVPRLNSPSGPVPAYSDLLLHDMGPGLADGIEMLDAGGSEFRTQPLWGLAASGFFLHDGRVATVRDAILAHGGESQASRDGFAALTAEQQADVLAFLNSLGGRDQYTPGLLPPEAPVPEVGAYGGPRRVLSADEVDQFIRGRAVFDRDFALNDGAGALTGADGIGRFNGDSCRACHFDPVIGGAGPRGVNVIRHGEVDGVGNFTPPAETPNTILHKVTRSGSHVIRAEATSNVFEHRQTPHSFGLGLIDAISEATIMANDDPGDADIDGISGRAHILGDGRIGRLGWKAQVPNVAEFVGDAMAAEIGLTLPVEAGLSFALTADGDGVPDPELSIQQTDDIIFFLRMLGGPPRQPAGDAVAVAQGEALFASVGCSKCHIPTLPSGLGDVPLYSDLLLHDILAPGTAGIEDGMATQTEFRTAPLWGVSQTPPYWHDGSADDIDAAIRAHDGEAAVIRDIYQALTQDEQNALQAFVGTL